MIDVHRHTERHHDSHCERHVRIAFGSRTHDTPPTDALGGLGGLSEIRLPPAGRCTPVASDAEETVTYVYSGALAVEESNGGHAIAYAGEFLRSALPPGAYDREIKAPKTVGAHVFRISLRGLKVGPCRAAEHTRFTAGQRRNKVCAVASPDARDGSLQIHQDAVVYSSILDAGHHFAYPLRPRRTAWVHLVAGSATLGALVLSVGDSVGVTSEPWVSFVAQRSSEILLIDVGSQDTLERRPSQ